MRSGFSRGNTTRYCVVPLLKTERSANKRYLLCELDIDAVQFAHGFPDLSIELLATREGNRHVAEFSDRNFQRKRAQMEGVYVVVHDLVCDALVDPTVRDYVTAEIILLSHTVVSPYFLVMTVLEDDVVRLGTPAHHVAAILDDLLP